MRALHSSLVGALLATFLFSAALALNQLPVPLYGWSGNYADTKTSFIPYVDSNGKCTPGDEKYNYAYMNYSFVGDGVRRLSSFFSYENIAVYSNGYDPNNPCAGNFIYLPRQATYDSYYWENYQWYTGGVSYTFVFWSDYDDELFSGILQQGWQNATSNSSGQQWNPVYVDQYNECYTDTPTVMPYYQMLPITMNTTGYYDIAAFFTTLPGNYPSAPSYTYTALFKGTPNGTLNTDACQAVGNNAELIDADYFSGQYAGFDYIYLVAGVLYNLVVSSGSGDFSGPFGWTVIPTQNFNLTNPTTTTGITTGGFNEPPRSSSYYGANCIQNTDTDYNQQPWAAVAYTVPTGWNYTLYCTQGGNDYEFFDYTGLNIPPVPCPATGSYFAVSDSGGPYDYYGPVLNSNQYTVVATPYGYGDDATGYQMRCYVTYGPAITMGGGGASTTGMSTTGNVVSTTGNVVSTTGAVSSTGVVSTTAKVTTGSTTIAVTTGSTTTKVTTGGTTSKVTTTGATTSSGSIGARMAGAVVLLAALFTLLL